MQTQRRKMVEAAIREHEQAEAEKDIELAVAWSVLLNGDEPHKGCAIVPSRASMRYPA